MKYTQSKNSYFNFTLPDFLDHAWQCTRTFPGPVLRGVCFMPGIEPGSLSQTKNFNSYLKYYLFDLFLLSFLEVG